MRNSIDVMLGDEAKQNEMDKSQGMDDIESMPHLERPRATIKLPVTTSGHSVESND